MRSILRLLLVVAIAGLVCAACTAAGGTAPAPTDAAAAVAAEASPVVTPANVTRSIEPMVMTDGQGDEVVTGLVTDVSQTVSETYKDVGDYTEVRDGVVVSTHIANDPRAAGTTRLAFSVNFYEKSGPVWATMTITNDAGTWDGPCTGASVGSGQLGPLSCWLAGGGAYEGWTYYQASRPSEDGVATETVGVIYQGEAPAR